MHGQNTYTKQDNTGVTTDLDAWFSEISKYSYAGVTEGVKVFEIDLATSKKYGERFNRFMTGPVALEDDAPIMAVATITTESELEGTINRLLDKPLYMIMKRYEGEYCVRCGEVPDSNLIGDQ
jgi:hypothetical protein